MSIILTTHARVRMQQRGIPQDQVDFLFEFGTERYDRSGKSWIFYDHRAKKSMQRQLPKEVLKHVKFNTYGIVEDGGVFVTVGHRIKRFNRH